MRFAYRARDEKGALVTGEVESPALDAMMDEMGHRGLVPLQVTEIKPGSVSLESIGRWFNRVKAEELMVFTRQFHTLFKAGVSIDTILDTLTKQSLGKAMQEATEQIRNDVRKGASLSQAFRQHPQVFDELYVSMIAAGEEAGILEQTMEELVKLIEKEDAIRRSIKSAMFYPKIVIFILICSIVTLMTFVVPKFETFFSHFKSELPLPTRIVIFTSHAVLDYWYIVLIIVSAIWYAFYRYSLTKSGRFTLDRIKFQVPVFGPLNLKVACARFGHILGALYKSGLPMARGLDVVANVIGNEAYAMEVRLIRDDIQRGTGLADSMKLRSYFPSIVIETTAVGERTGALDEMLEAIAAHFDLEVSHNIKNLTALLEPILLVGIFAVVAVVALAIFLPIWGMSEAVQKGG